MRKDTFKYSAWLVYFLGVALAVLFWLDVVSFSPLDFIIQTMSLEFLNYQREGVSLLIYNFPSGSLYVVLFGTIVKIIDPNALMLKSNFKIKTKD